MAKFSLYSRFANSMPFMFKSRLGRIQKNTCR